jgi:hypothetical protein
MSSFPAVWQLVLIFSKRTTTDGIAIFEQTGLACFFKIKLESSVSRDIIRQY